MTFMPIGMRLLAHTQSIAGDGEAHAAVRRGVCGDAGRPVDGHAVRREVLGPPELAEPRLALAVDLPRDRERAGRRVGDVRVPSNVYGRSVPVEVFSVYATCAAANDEQHLAGLVDLDVVAGGPGGRPACVSSAVRVRALTTPSRVKLLTFWNASTACVVSVPKMPSAVPSQ